MRIAAVTLLAVLALAAPAARAAGQPRTETADAGPVHAEFSYVVEGEGEYSGLDLKVFQSGALVREDRIPDADYYAPGGFADTPSVHAEDLDGDGTVEVVLDLYTGGAHCCFESRVYRGSAPYVERDWGDIGYRRVDLDGDGRHEFLSADPAFSAAFTSFAGSRFPLQAFAWQGTGLVDITRTPALRSRLRTHASRLRKDYRRADRAWRRHHRGIRTRERLQGTLPAYAADECSLGDCARGLDLLRSARRRGEVDRAFVRDVRRVLKAGGYLG